MELLGISICVTLLVLAVSFFRQHNSRVLIVGAVVLLAFDIWLTTRFATAYRLVGSPPAKDLVQGPAEAWRLGACEMNRLIVHAYVPVSVTLAVGLALLVVLAVRSKQGTP